MTSDEFENYMTNNIFYEELLPYFNFFENHINDINETYEDLTAFRNSIINSFQNFKPLGTKLHKNGRELLKTYHNSFNGYVKYFVKENDHVSYKFLKKYKTKIILSYYSLSRMIMQDSRIESRKNSKLKSMMCISLIDLEHYNDDEIRANREIMSIKDIEIRNYENKDVLIIMLLGCRYELFRNILEKYQKKYNIEYLHIAGHTGNNKLLFVDGSVGIKSIQSFLNKLNHSIKYIFINTCNSYQFVNEKNLSGAVRTICYSGLLNDNLALSFCENFYSQYYMNNTYCQSFNTVFNSDKQSYENYKMLRSSHNTEKNKSKNYTELS